MADLSRELLPCPLCFGPVRFHSGNDCEGCHHIECDHCGYLIDFSSKADPDNRCETLDELKEKCAELWNRRTALSDDSVRVPAHADVLAERKRQIDVEGWTPEHDDSHDKGDMALAGACYAMHTSMMYLDCAKDDVPSPWPWDKSWWKPKDPRRNLVRAAALILAEIERIDRLAASEKGA